jgi:hypothetical protein
MRYYKVLFQLFVSIYFAETDNNNATLHKKDDQCFAADDFQLV